MQLDLSSLRRVLLVRLDNIGDIVMLTPAIRALRAALPRARFDLMASPAGALCAPLIPEIDAVRVHRALWQDASAALPFDPAREVRLIARLRAGRFDAALIFTSFSQTPFAAAHACYLAGIPVRAGQTAEFGGAVLSHAVAPAARDGHQVDRNLHLLNALGIPSRGRDPALVLPGSAVAGAALLLEHAGVHRPYIVLAPGASCAARRYDPGRYAEVARALAARLQRPVLLLGTKWDAERCGPLSALREPHIVPLFGRSDLAQSAAIIAHAALVVGNNSAPMHIAEAFGRPVVVLFSGTDLESQWRPRRAPAVLLHRPADCAPCYGFTCPRGHECLDVPPDEIVEAAQSLLAAQPAREARVA